ncbi:hypothetical protein ACHAXS_002054, partial [Conticribra weissflogii]
MVSEIPCRFHSIKMLTCFSVVSNCYFQYRRTTLHVLSERIWDSDDFGVCLPWNEQLF